MASHILGISGRKRSGKDTLAARLIDRHGFTRVAFADPLKELALHLDPVIDAVVFSDGSHQDVRLAEIVSCHGWESAKSDPEIRRLLQDLGVGVRTYLGESTWVDAAMATAASIPGPVVITDVRFPNEVEAVRAAGGSIVRVNRPGLPDTDLHVSETALDALVADYVVSNSGTIAQLQTKASTIALDLLRR